MCNKQEVALGSPRCVLGAQSYQYVFKRATSPGISAMAYQAHIQRGGFYPLHHHGAYDRCLSSGFILAVTKWRKI